MLRLLVDTDVLIDVALDRLPHSEASADFLDRAERGRCQAFVAWHTLSNFYYLVKSGRGDANTRAFIGDLLQFVAVVPTATADIRYAISLGMSDFEDAMQVAAASACQAGYIVTRNVNDFARSPIPAMTPNQAVEALS